jgi:hypothetical protein
MTSQLPRPLWAERPSLRAFWVAIRETPEWIAARTDTLLSELRSPTGITEWQTHTGDRWAGPPAKMTDFVRSSVVRDRPTGNADKGEPLSDEGYSFILSGNATGVALQIQVAAGAAVLAARLPMHTLLIKFRETSPGGVTSELGDAVCAAVASTWEPSTLALSDSPTNREARRGGWKINVGYRTWISAAVGAVKEVAPGLSTTKLADGTMISAPDDWPAKAVVDSMMASLKANGLDEVPH